MFSLFPTKRELFIAAVGRGFERTMAAFSAAPEATIESLGDAYIELLATDRDLLTLQLHAYAAACQDDTIAADVRVHYDGLLAHVGALTGAGDDELAEFAAHGMWLNVQAAMNVGDLEAACEWMVRRREAS